MERFFSLDDVSYCYPGATTTGVCQVSLDLEPGTFLAVLGANGSGKSTLARLCCGLLKPSSGRVMVGGFATDREEELNYIYERVGIVFQHPENQFVASTVEREIAFGVENRTRSVQLIRTAVDAALSRFGLTALKTAQPQSLSGGEKRLLSLADIWVLKPKLILVDEPLAMLDPGARKRITHLLGELRKAGQSLIWFTHSIAEVSTADQVLVMDKGRVVWRGNPAALLAIPAQVMAWGLKLPPATQVAFDLGMTKRVISNENELVSALWK
jgi:energy-coupling factor transporter ATP-binding protein EcfA2